MKTRKILSLLLTLMLVLIPFKSASADGDMRVERVYGTSRFDTAVAISRACFTDTDFVVVASGSNFPDALAGGVLAETVKAPVLLTYKDTLPPATENEIARLTPSTIYVLGGANAISEAVTTKLAAYGTVKRLEGYSRFDTAKAIANEIKSQDPKTGEAFGIVNAYNFADALGASAFLAKKNMPLLLDQKELQATRDTILFGGIAAVPHKPYGDRIAGQNRVATSLAIAKAGFPESKTVILTNGWNYPDALAAISLSVKFDAPIILTQNNALDVAVTDYIKTNSINHAIIIGGERAVSKGVERAIENVYNAPQPEVPVTPIPNPEEPPVPTPEVPTPPTIGTPTKANYYNRTQEELDKVWVNSDGNGLIKGNVNSKKERIYHVPGWNSYNATVITPSKGERWFKTERQAIDSGWKPDEKYMRGLQ